MKDEGKVTKTLWNSILLLWFSEFAVQKINPSVTDNTLQCHEINLLNLDNRIDEWHEISIRPRKCGKNDKLRINVGPRKFIWIF